MRDLAGAIEEVFTLRGPALFEKTMGFFHVVSEKIPSFF